MVDLGERESRLSAYLESTGYAAVWFGEPATFGWATGGDNRVDRSAAVGEAAVGYTADDEWWVVTNNVEAERLAAEELPVAFTASVVSNSWHEATLAQGVAARSPTPAVADFDVPGFDTLDPTALRLRLGEDDRRRYRRLAAEVREAVEAVCREAQSTDTEREVAAGLRVGLERREIEAPVVLVGGSARAQSYRHFTPSRATLDDYALVSVTGRRAGMHVSCTRTVAFDPPDWLHDRHRAAATVETAALGATSAVAGGRDSPGRAGAVFDAIREAYADAGWEDEWEHHHQGGATGYAGREWFVTPESKAPVLVPAAYAYNPTVQGAKSEGTALVTSDGVDVVTTGDDWPTITVESGELELERPAVLEL